MIQVTQADYVGGSGGLGVSGAKERSGSSGRLGW
jgi:hypothetical protein